MTQASKNEIATVRAVANPNSTTKTSVHIFGQTAEPIKAFCTASRPAWRHGRENKQWSLVVDRCPLCGHRHVHGGADGETPILGDRAAHCVDGTGGYTLVDASGVYK